MCQACTSCSSAETTITYFHHTYSVHVLGVTQNVLSCLCIQLQLLQECVYLPEKDLVIHGVLREFVSNLFAV
jgi:hypothetical protein